MDDESGKRLADITNGNPPFPILNNHAGITDLAAALHVERSRSQHQFDLIALPRRVHYLPVPHYGCDFCLGLRPLGVEMLHAGCRQRRKTSLRRPLQFIQKTAVDFQLLPHLQHKVLSGPSQFSLLLQRGHEALFVHSEPPLFGHVPRQIQGEAIGVVELESLVPRNHSLSPRDQAINQIIQQIKPHIQRALKTLLFLSDGLQDELLPGL